MRVINTYKRPLPSKNEYSYIFAVLTVGEHNDYAVYISACDDEEWTMKYGNKLSFEEARFYYPGLTMEEYRR